MSAGAAVEPSVLAEEFMHLEAKQKRAIRAILAVRAELKADTETKMREGFGRVHAAVQEMFKGPMETVDALGRDVRGACARDIASGLERGLESIEKALYERGLSLGTDLRAEIRTFADGLRADTFSRITALGGQIESDRKAVSGAIGAATERLTEFVMAEIGKVEAKHRTELAHIETSTRQEFAASVATPKSFIDSFRGNFKANERYARGDIFTFRGASYIVLADAVEGQMPSIKTQREPNRLYAVIAAAGAPGPNVQNAGGGGSAGVGGIVAATNGASTQTITFATPFTTACTGVSAVLLTTGSSGFVVGCSLVGLPTKTGFTVAYGMAIPDDTWKVSYTATGT